MNNNHFKNREDAGRRLTILLEKYRDKNALILALPRGGVVIGQVIAQSLNLPLGLIVVRKIGHPLNPEFAIAAISESGQIVPNKIEMANVDSEWLRKTAAKELKEAKRRRQRYWGKREKIPLKDKIVIIVDDGLATGLTMMAAILEVKKQNPRKIIVAVPVSPLETAAQIKKMVDEFVAISIPNDFLGAVGAYYENFSQISDKEVIGLL